MIVVDAGVWATALIDAGPTGDACRAALSRDDAWTAPEHAALETLRTIRRFEFAGVLDATQADEHARAVADFSIRYVGAEPWVLTEVWRLRHTVSPYDAPYVALALAMGAPLVTLDKRLGRAAEVLGVTALVPTSA